MHRALRQCVQRSRARASNQLVLLHTNRRHLEQLGVAVVPAQWRILAGRTQSLSTGDQALAVNPPKAGHPSIQRVPTSTSNCLDKDPCGSHLGVCGHRPRGRPRSGCSRRSAVAGKAKRITGRERKVTSDPSVELRQRAKLAAQRAIDLATAGLPAFDELRARTGRFFARVDKKLEDVPPDQRQPPPATIAALAPCSTHFLAKAKRWPSSVRCSRTCSRRRWIEEQRTMRTPDS